MCVCCMLYYFRLVQRCTICNYDAGGAELRVLPHRREDRRELAKKRKKKKKKKEKTENAVE